MGQSFADFLQYFFPLLVPSQQVFCFMIMTVWAMLIVEWIYPCVESMYENTDAFVDCGEYCLQATSSVMHANLLLFKTVIAGDSWGLIAVPVIQQHPATAIIFMGSLLTLVFGVLNLIVAVTWFARPCEEYLAKLKLYMWNQSLTDTVHAGSTCQ